MSVPFIPFAAGEALLDWIGLTDALAAGHARPKAEIGDTFLYRDPDTLSAVEYFFKAPEDMAERRIVVLDPMLATANSAIAAVDRLTAGGATDMRFVCLLAAPVETEWMQRVAMEMNLSETAFVLPEGVEAEPGVRRLRWAASRKCRNAYRAHHPQTGVKTVQL